MQIHCLHESLSSAGGLRAAHMVIYGPEKKGEIWGTSTCDAALVWVPSITPSTQRQAAERVYPG